MATAAKTALSQKSRPLSDYSPLDELAGSFAERLVSPEEEIIIAEQMEELYGKIHALLSSFEQQVLTLYLSGHSYLEISQLLRTSPKAVDNALQRVRRKLRSV
jgi:RNA polymerase sporulation-specific sigma factor